jgi:hypothetical protein
MVSNPTLPTENINQVILGLLSLEPNEIDDLDYETYKSYLKELLVEVIASKRKIGDDEFDLVKNEFKRVRGKKGRFKIKKTKISADKFGLGGITKQIKGTQKRLMLAPVGGVPKTQEKIETISQKTKESPLLKISETLDSILSTLIDIGKQDAKEREKNRRSEEEKRRIGRESSLESKTFEGIKKAISTITKPLQSIWDKIVNFITNIILGRIVLKLIDWIADPKNQGKIQSIIRFFGDHWPVLLALYLRFGTGIGRFVGKLGGILVKGAFKLAGLAAKLALKAGIGKAGGRLSKVAGFLGGKKGKALATGIGIAADVAVTAGAAYGAEKLLGGGEEKPQPVQKLSGGGYVKPRFPAFSGGGFNFRGMMGGASMGAMFGPLGMLLGGALGSGKPQEMFSGLVSGPGGPKDDKVPAMLSDGEFVMSAGAVQKYGVDTLEGMNAAGGGTNKPKVVDGTTYAAGGGLVGETPKEIRLRKSYGYRFGEDLTSKLTNDQLRQISNHYNSLSASETSRLDSRRTMGYGDELKDMAEKMIRGNNPQSFTQSSRAASGLDDLAKKFDMDAKTAPRYAENLPKLNKPTPRIDPSRMLPSAGQSSANAMRAAAKAAQNVRPPIPTSSSIVPYAGGGLARTGVTGGLSVPQIRTNMKVPGGFGGSTLVGGLKSAGVEMLASYLIQQGVDKFTAMTLAKQIDDGRKLTGDKKKNYIERLRNVVDKEERWQKGPGGTFDSIIRMGGESSSQKLSKHATSILEGIGSGAYRGGGIKGGYGLKEQSFKDAPKTQIMTDDNGKPFIGHKAMRGGKIVYVRGPQPGTGTTNPLEALGRMINPGAYKDIDATNERKKYEEASRNSVSSLRARGASQATIARRQTQLKTGVKPLPRATPRPQVAGGGMGGRRGGGTNPPRQGTKPPSQSPTHRKGTMTSASAYGIMR